MNDELFENLPLLLAVPQAAQILGISRASAYRLVKAGELPTRRLGGRVYILRRPSESWVQREGQTLSIDRFCLLNDT